MTKQEKKEIEKTSAEVAVVDSREKMLAEMGSELMDEIAVDTGHLKVSKILMMQGLSDLVAEDRATPGELRGSLEANLMAKKGEHLELVLFGVKRSWLVSKHDGNRYVFEERLPYNATNADLEWDVETSEGKFKNQECLSYYALPVDEINSEDGCIPYLLEMKSTSFKNAKKIETFRAKLAEFKKPLAFKTVKVWSKSEKNDHGTYYILDAELGRNTTEKELSTAIHWNKMLKERDVHIDDTDLHASNEAPATAAREEASEDDQY